MAVNRSEIITNEITSTIYGSTYEAIISLMALWPSIISELLSFLSTALLVACLASVSLIAQTDLGALEVMCRTNRGMRSAVRR